MDSISTRIVDHMTGVGHLTPMITAAPMLDLRQEDEDDEMATCGIIEILDGHLAITCPSDCTTSGSYFGCANYFYTTCFNFDDAVCTEAISNSETLGQGTWCCTEGNYPLCATISKSVDGETLTQFECFETLEGEFSAREAETETTSATSSSLIESETTSASEAEATETLDESDDDGGSSTPTGAIVGGVVGGVALIAMVAFFAWFIRFQKRKHAYIGKEAQFEGSPPTFPDSPAGIHPSPPIIQPLAPPLGQYPPQQFSPNPQFSHTSYYNPSQSPGTDYNTSMMQTTPAPYNGSPAPMPGPNQISPSTQGQGGSPPAGGAAEVPTHNRSNAAELQ